MSIVERSLSSGLIESRARQIAACEMGVMVLSVLLAEWYVLESFGRNLVTRALPIVVIAALMFLSHRAQHESLRLLGWRLDNLGEALGLLWKTVVIISAILIVIGSLSGSLQIRIFGSNPAFVRPVWLLVWGGVQQHALQGFINRRSQLIWGAGSSSVLVVGSLFAILHFPNPLLMLGTFFFGIFCAVVYQRSPNLFALALAHAVLTIVLISTISSSALHGMRVGLYYR